MNTPLALEILPAHTPALLAVAAQRAASLLRAGELVALPTETVYGLAANAFDAVAVAKLFAVKGRPARNPIIVHVADERMARQCVNAWPVSAARLARAFWPGPLTLVLPRAGCIPDVVAAGGTTVGVRWPSHPVMQAVIRACGFPLAAPSANPANRLSPTTVEHVCQSLGNRIRLIVDGGPCAIGIESTVLDLTSDPPRLLRPGMIHETALAAVLGQGPLPPSAPKTAETLRSPGQLPRHYAPRARLLVWTWDDETALRRRMSQAHLPAGRCHVIAHSRIPSHEGLGGISVLPREANAFARALYAELHRCDRTELAAIVVEAPPDAPEWRGIADRLSRAAS